MIASHFEDLPKLLLHRNNYSVNEKVRRTEFIDPDDYRKKFKDL